MQALVIASLIFALGVAVFVSQNVTPVVVKLVFWSTETPLAVVVIIASTLGALIMGLPGWLKQLTTSIKMRKLLARYKDLEEENEELEEQLTKLHKINNEKNTLRDEIRVEVEESSKTEILHSEAESIPPYMMPTDKEDDFSPTE